MGILASALIIQASMSVSEREEKLESVVSDGALPDSLAQRIIPSALGGNVARGDEVQPADHPSSSKSCFHCFISIVLPDC